MQRVSTDPAAHIEISDPRMPSLRTQRAHGPAWHLICMLLTPLWLCCCVCSTRVAAARPARRAAVVVRASAQNRREVRAVAGPAAAAGGWHFDLQSSSCTNLAHAPGYAGASAHVTVGV
jgi:hypothetical protein